MSLIIINIKTKTFNQERAKALLDDLEKVLKGYKIEVSDMKMVKI